jgi:hypothetical protein
MIMKWAVDLVEYEAGWGSRLDEVRLFDTFEEAEAYVKDFNSENTEATPPDWYMVANGPYRKKV